MLKSGDWVTARLDGVSYLEKPPLIYWMMAGSYKIFGVHDWVARIPIALSVLRSFCSPPPLACGLSVKGWLLRRTGAWRPVSGCTLFTRIIIPDVILTFTITLSMWALLRVIDEEEPHPRSGRFLSASASALGLLVKSLIGACFSPSPPD